MTAYDWCAIAAIAALIVSVAWYSGDPDDQVAWNASTTTRTEDDIHADVAKARAARTPAIEQQPGDPYSDDRIAAELIYIPQQRTEDHR